MALAVGWPGRAVPAARPESLGIASAQRLQEVPPPAAVQQLQEALADRAPQVRILEPAADTVLSAEPWSLRLQVDDWPLVDGGDLGLGPHLLVQIDGQEPIRLTRPEATLPPLSPGSHRLTVVAARPWGEAVKSPGAMAQIRLHRTAPNPLSLPAAGSPQLLPVSPPALAVAEPLLLDWLLVDAPLQHLRDDDARWRLRVTVNGDSFLVDRQTPLWLRGWRPGTNAVQLELLDGRGEALNAPFNSLVLEVKLEPGQPRPAWLGGRLSPSDLAILLGQAPAVPPAVPEAPAVAPTETQPPEALARDGLSPEVDAPGATTEPEPETEPTVMPAATIPEAEPEVAEPEETEESREIREAPQAPAAPPAPQAPEPETPLPTAEAATGPADTEPPAQSPPIETSPAAEERSDATPAAPSPSLRPAREEVNADGTLRREPRRGPLAGLRERLAG